MKRNERLGRSGGDQEDAVRDDRVPSTVDDGAVRKGVPPIGADARSRRFLAARLNSSRDYAHFAAAAGADIFDGEPIERFAAVGKLDERTLRMRAQELREDMFVEATRDRPARKEIGA